MNKRIKLRDAVKFFALFSLFLYFVTIMVFSYKTEYFKISHMFFAALVGFVGLYRLIKVDIVLSPFYLFMVIFVLLSTSSYYWAIEKSVVTERVSSYFSLIFFSVVIINIIETPKELTFSFKAFAIAGAFMCLYTFFFYGFDQIKLMMLEGDRFGQEINEANSFGLICGISFAISTCYAVFDRKKIFYAISLLLVIATVMSGSRTSIVGIIFISMLIVVFNAASKKIISTSIIVIVIVIIYNLLAQSQYFQNTFQRFELFGNFFSSGNNMITADNSTETRFEMMKYGLLWFKDNPIVGYGVEQYSMLYELNFGRRRPAHNFHIQMLVEFGVVGFALWEGMFIHLINKARKHLKSRTESKIIVITISYLLLAGFGNMFTYEKVFWGTLGLCFSYLYVYRSDFTTKNKRILYSSQPEETVDTEE